MRARKQSRWALARSIIALRLRPAAHDGSPVLTQLAAGRVFEINGSAAGRTGMVQVNRKGERYAVFADDLKACALEIRTRS